LAGYDLRGRSTSQLVIRARQLGDERMVVIDLAKSLVRLSSYSGEERGIKTSQCSAEIGANLLTTENKP
jgi:hypothetical protein